MKNITIKYGTDVRTVTVADSTTVAQLIADPTTRVVLGYGDNVKPLCNGVEQPGDAVPSDGSVITLETRANSKAI